MATDFNILSLESLFIGLVHLLMHKIWLVGMHIPAHSVAWCNSATLISNSLGKNPSVVLLRALHMYMEAANKVHGRARQEGEICSLVNAPEMRGGKNLNWLCGSVFLPSQDGFCLVPLHPRKEAAPKALLKMACNN